MVFYQYIFAFLLTVVQFVQLDYTQPKNEPTNQSKVWPTKSLIGEWKYLNPKEGLGIEASINFSIDGKYNAYISSLHGEGYWSLNKSKTKLIIKKFRYTNMKSFKKNQRIKFYIEEINDDTLVLSIKGKKERIINTYEKIK